MESKVIEKSNLFFQRKYVQQESKSRERCKKKFLGFREWLKMSGSKLLSKFDEFSSRPWLKDYS